MARSGYIDIAVGIVKTHDERVKRLNILNQTIDDYADTIRSSGNLDSMPHKTGHSCPVEERMVKIEEAEEIRDAWQEHVSAVEFAKQSIEENFEGEMGTIIADCAMQYLSGNHNDALYEYEEACDLPLATLMNARTQIITAIVKYLHFK